MAQGATRMNEIEIRKTNGASMGDIIRQFFSEVTGIVGIAFAYPSFYLSQFSPLDILGKRLVEGEFFKEDRPENTPTIILNEATVKLLGLKSPELAHIVFRKFDSAFIPNPVWSENIYAKKFDGMKTQFKLVFVVPILIQYLIAIITTSGMSINVLSQNPIKALKSE